MLRLALLCAVPAAASTAAAQARDSASRSDTVPRLPVVQVTRSILPVAGPAIGSGIPARVSVTAAAELERWEPWLLSDALTREPGASLYDDLGSPNKTTLVMRGFTASPVVGLPQGVSIFVDGVPVNEPDAGQVNFDLLPLEHVERVEMLSGTASLLGPHSLGGAVNLITRRDHNGRDADIEIAGGSYDSYSADLSFAAGVARGWSYYAGGGYAREGGWRQLTQSRQRNAFLNVSRLALGVGLNVQAFVTSGYAKTAGSLPLSVYRARPDSNLSAGDSEDLDQIHVALSGYRALSSGHASGVLYLRQNDAERFNVNQETDPDVRSFSDNRTAGANADWRTGRALGPAVMGSATSSMWLSRRAGAGG